MLAASRLLSVVTTRQATAAWIVVRGRLVDVLGNCAKQANALTARLVPGGDLDEATVVGDRVQPPLFIRARYQRQTVAGYGAGFQRLSRRVD